MAVPRIFVSSTYYDLRQVRNNIGNFIKSLGYEPVMHEKSGVAYTQTTALEHDCYNELNTCDIVICIIGNHFGTKAENEDLSITMKELETAIKAKKKIYVFIAKDVNIENRTYAANKETAGFTPVCTDNIEIHKYILDLKHRVRNNYIGEFETTEEIIQTLKLQFAGLFQNLLNRESSLTEEKTAYDLQETAEEIKDLIVSFNNEKEAFFSKFDSSIFATNFILKKIKLKLGMEKSTFFAKDVEALDEFMSVIGFESVDCDDPFDDYRKYVCEYADKKVSLVMKNELFEESGKLKDIRNSIEVDKYLFWNEEEKDDDDLPF